MNIVFVTSTSDPLAGVFWQAYKNSNGPSPKAIFFLSGNQNSDYSLWKKFFVSFFLFGLRGTFRLAAASYLKVPLIARDKKMGLHLNPFALLASENCQFFYYKSINQEPAFSVLKSLKPDILVSAGAPAIFRQRILQISKLGAINIHNGQLPKYRGHFGTFWEVYNREEKTYISIHKMVEKVDAGEMIAFECLRIADFPKFLDLMIEKKYRGGKLLAKVLREIQEQNEIPKTKRIKDETSKIEKYFGFPFFRDILNFWWINQKKLK